MKDFNLGGRFFYSPDSGAKINYPEKIQSLRWTNAANSLVVGTPLTSLAGNANVTLDLPIGGSAQYIRVQSIIVNALFNDFSTGAAYNVSDRVSISPLAQTGNQDNKTSFSFPNRMNNNPLNLLLAVGGVVAQAVQITVVFTGGDALQLSGITPAASDFVTFSLSVSYF